jgi:hypothetical protein
MSVAGKIMRKIRTGVRHECGIQAILEQMNAVNLALRMAPNRIVRVAINNTPVERRNS